MRGWLSIMIIKKNLNEQIYESLKTDILNHTIKFGEKLVNRDLREHFGVSSTPVRDAINRLYQDGLLEDISNVGARVITFTPERAIEINEVVSMLNVEAIRMSAKKSQPEKMLPVLRECVELQSKYIDDDRYFLYDKQFHMIFFDFCNNSRFRQIYVQQQPLWEILVKFYYSDETSAKLLAIQQHVQMIDAYSKGNIDLAQRYMDSHYQNAEQAFLRMMHESQQGIV